jgi:UDP-glucuronate decarboxylase
VIHSDGKPTRTFCYTADALTGYLLLLLSDNDADPVNIGASSPEISMADLARLVIEVSGRDAKVIFRSSADADYMADSPRRRCPDISRAREALGYEPKVTLEDGLSRLHRWYVATRGGGAWNERRG